MLDNTQHGGICVALARLVWPRSMALSHCACCKITDEGLSSAHSSAEGGLPSLPSAYARSHCSKFILVYRYAVKTLMWSFGFEVEVLNMSDSTNSSSLPSVDFLNRSDWKTNQHNNTVWGMACVCYTPTLWLCACWSVMLRSCVSSAYCLCAQLLQCFK